MSRTSTPLDPKKFAEAQASELGNWQSGAANPIHVQHELDEHSEIEHPLREICGSETFRRGLEVGIGKTIWHDRPGLFQRLTGHGRMSFWVRRKEKT